MSPLHEQSENDGTPLLYLAAVIAAYFVLVRLCFGLGHLCWLLRGQPRPQHAGELRRVQVGRLLQTKGVLDAIDVMQAMSSVLMCLFYISETYGVHPTGVVQVEYGITVLLLFDYLLRFYLARSRIQYLYSFFAVVDVLTILPVLMITVGAATGGASTGTAGSTSVILLRMVRISKLLRAVRSMRIHRAVPKYAGGVTREIFRLFCITMSLCLIAAGLMQVFENGLDMPEDGYELPFHEAFYFISIEVWGRPRIPVNGANSHLYLVGVVVASIILIPRQVNQIWQVMQREPEAMRRQYVKRNDNHIVVMGQVEFPVLNLLMYEIYHPDRGSERPCDVVVLSPLPPDRDTELLLENPAYDGHVQYLQGSCHRERDLDRAQIDCALAVMVIANKYPDDIEMEETRIAAMVLAAKAHKNAALHKSRSFDGRRRLRVLAQVLRVETRDRIQQMPGWDRDGDVCVVVGDMNAAMLTVSAIHRGLAVLVLNLISHLNHDSSPNSERWSREYHAGCSHELYHCSIPPNTVLQGKTVMEGAKDLLQMHQMPLIAVKSQGKLVFFPDTEHRIQAGDRVYAIAASLPELVSVVKHEAGPTQFALSLWMKTARQAPSSSTLWLAHQEPPRKQVVRGSGTYVLQKSPRRESIHEQLHKVTHAVREGFGSALSHGVRSANHSASLSDSTPSQDAAEWGGEGAKGGARRAPKYCDLQDMLARLYEGNLQALETDVVQLRSAMESDEAGDSPSHDTSYCSSTRVIVTPTYFPRRQLSLRGLHAPRRQGSSTLIALGSDTRNLDGHIIACGADEKFLVTIARMVRVMDPSLHVALLFNGDLALIEEEAKSQGLDQAKVSILFGHAGCVQALGALNAQRAHSIIVAPSMGCTWEWGDPQTGLEHRRVVDSDTILTTNIVAMYPSSRQLTPGARPVDLETSASSTQKEVEHVWTVTQLVQEGSLTRFWGMAPEAQGGNTFVNPRWMAAPPVNQSPLFAAGHIVSSTTADRLLVESFFNSAVLRMLGCLFGIPGFLASLDPRGPCSSQIGGSCVFEVPVRGGGIDHCDTYGELCMELLASDSPLLALGLFRYPGGMMSSYSMLVSLEARNELDFRAPAGLAEAAAASAGRANRLPYVVTNPTPDMPLFDTDSVFVLGVHPRRGGLPAAAGSPTA